MSRADILVVDDEPDIRRLLQEILEDENYTVHTAADAAGARAAFARHHPDLVLLDIWMPDTDGITLLKEWQHDDTPAAPVIMMSGHGNIETAVESTRLGAYDFLEKPLSMGKLLVTVERALESSKLQQENLRLRQQMAPVSALTGNSRLMQQLREQIERVAGSEAWVLITGEPGSGKAVAARYLHQHSPRKDGPFAELSLAAIPRRNVSTQLFGSEEGGRVVPGSFEQADGGTLLLNEIGDLDPDIQVKLLHALEEQRFLRLGGTQPVDVDVRIVATSSQDLEQAVKAGRFREELYYRLNVVPIHMPPLRDHREDVPQLVNFFVDWLTEKEHLGYRKFTTEALNRLRNHSWPGNIRELKNLIQRLLILDGEMEVDAREIDRALRGEAEAPAAGGQAVALFDLPLRRARDAFEKAYLEHHLRETDGNVSELAAIAGMERTHLYRKLKQLGINPKQAKERRQ